jgi:hypothetical protein
MSTKSLDRQEPSVRIASLLIVVTAAAVTVASQLAGPVPARAIPSVPSHPPCTNNWVAYGPVIIEHSDGLSVHLNWNDKMADSTPDSATVYLADGTPAQVDDQGHPVQHGGNKLFDSYHSDQTGTPAGGVQGNNIDLTIVWDSTRPISSNHYTGTFNQDGWATGTVTNSGNHITTNWNFDAAFPCGG